MKPQRSTIRLRAAGAMAFLCLSAGLSLAIQPAQDGTPAPEEEDEGRVFVLSDTCRSCHDASPDAEALWTATGEDASPHGTWKGTVMANSFFDPYWRAQLSRELEAAPEEEHAALEALCTRCHTPAAVHEARLSGEPLPRLSQLLTDPAAHEGVTCTVCHRMTDEGLGEKSTMNGNLPMDLELNLYGPYPNPVQGPMAAMTGYDINYGPHMVQSSLCGTCHTLETMHAPGAKPFLEQSPYLEWRNSVYSYETAYTEESRSCQACHMPEMGDMKLAHNPGGFDFPFLEDREAVTSHAIVGGNAFLLDMLAIGKEKLGVLSPLEDLAKNADLTRRQLAHSTANLDVENPRVEGDRVMFEIAVENLAGHKLPSAYPSRRVWLEVQIESSRETWFACGVPDEAGRLMPRGEQPILPHLDTITAADQIQVYQTVALDEHGKQTTLLSRMASVGKDNRLLPKGWKMDGPHSEQTNPVGVGEDKNFVGGSDRVHFAIQIPEEHRSKGLHVVSARLLYQSIPPDWADAHRDSERPEAVTFIDLYDQVPTRYEVLAETRRRILR
ncbi:MAG: hypothetical protein P1V35_10645 [Planctomycetota bacterium]|nr:hypothetical protein [Planctomycetota bacterium]